MGERTTITTQNLYELNVQTFFAGAFIGGGQNGENDPEAISLGKCYPMNLSNSKQDVYNDRFDIRLSIVSWNEIIYNER